MNSRLHAVLGLTIGTTTLIGIAAIAAPKRGHAPSHKPQPYMLIGSCPYSSIKPVPRILREYKIPAWLAGSRAEGIYVPPKDADRAAEILRRDSKKHHYFVNVDSNNRRGPVLYL